MKQIILLLIIGLSFTAAWAQSSGSRPWLLSTGAAAREAKRFTLQEWLENKDRRALMDMWLTINTPSPYEFVLGGSMFHYTADSTASGTTASKTVDGYSGEISAYARFVGVTAEYTNNTNEGFNDVTGIFNLRIFGNTVQGSHITLHYGLRTRTASDNSYRLNQQFAAATLQLYLMKYFGIQGNYRKYLPYSEDHFGETEGNEINAGAFIEFGALRLFGDWYQEKQNSKLNGVESNIDRTGTKIGIKFYFE
jgi:hypothetical protein